jgi:hypothetical protein
VWDYLNSKGQANKEDFMLSEPVVNEIVQHYLTDLKILKYRYKIKDKIQLHKVAGLITSLIVRYRPILPLVQTYSTEDEMYMNEKFAIIHGLSICAEYSNEDILTLINEPWFDTWYRDFIYLLHVRHHTPESLTFIFETLCVFKFPNNMAHEYGE